MKNILTIAVVLSMVSALMGCGGGGGDAKTPTTPTNNLSLAVVDFNGNVVNGITFGGGQRIRAIYTDSNGVPLSSKLVTFSVTTNGSAVTLGNTTAATGNNGQASVTVAPATPTSSGAATVTAAVGGLTTTVDFAISGSTSTVGTLSFGSTTLIASGNTSVRAPVTAGGSPAGGVNVSFSATCGTITPSSTVSDGSGVASTNYSAIKSDGTSCSGPVTISAIGPDYSSTGTLAVTAPVASAINFMSATPSQIYVTGSGASTQSVLKFKVLDASGGASVGVPVKVKFKYQNSNALTLQGVGLNALGSTAEVTATSDSTGVITLTVFSGGIPGPVQVIAYLPDTPAVYAYSQVLTVQYGPPSQNHFSVSVTTFNIEGMDWDGTNTSLTARVADRQGNAVPAGTVVNFTTSGGQIGGSCTVTLSSDGLSSCSAVFSSQSPRPPNGRVAVLAYTEGLKEYIDVNGNNVFDAGVDTLVDMGDAYRDDDESGTFDSNLGEFVVPRGGSGTCAGKGWPAPSRANTCDSTTASATVRKQVMLIMSGRTALPSQESVARDLITFHLTDDNGFSGNGTQLHPVYVNPMPYGTTVSASPPGGVTACTVVSVFPAFVKNIAPTLVKTDDLGTDHAIKLSGCNAGEKVSVKVTTPKGNETTWTYTLP